MHLIFAPVDPLTYPVRPFATLSERPSSRLESFLRKILSKLAPSKTKIKLRGKANDDQSNSKAMSEAPSSPLDIIDIEAMIAKDKEQPECGPNRSRERLASQHKSIREKFSSLEAVECGTAKEVSRLHSDVQRQDCLSVPWNTTATQAITTLLFSRP